MMIEKSGTIRLRDIPTAAGLSPKDQELAAGMVRVTHLYRSALKVAVTQMEILDEEFARLYDHSPIHHIEYRIKTLDSIIDKLRRRGLEVSIDNIYAHIQDVAGIRVICNYLDDIYYLRSLLTRSESYTVLREVDYIKEPKAIGSGGLEVFGTPFMMGLMEYATMQCLQPELPEGKGTVGVEISSSHLAPTPVGMKVTATAEVTGISANGKMITFKVTAHDADGLIGEGIHTRAVIDNARFLQKCNDKLARV